MKICLVDDEQNIRRLVAYDLKQANYEVFSFEHGQDAFEASKTQSFDAYIVDWMMPVLDGIGLVKQLRSKGVQSLIIMLTAKSEEEDLIEAFEAGVDDYLTKPFSSRELLIRLKTHLSRLQPKETSIQNIGGLSIDRIKREIKLQDEILDLTKVEFDLFIYFISNLEKVCTRDDILNELWGFDYDGDTRIVDVHVFKLRTKLEASTLRFTSIRGMGYRMDLK